MIPKMLNKTNSYSRRLLESASRLSELREVGNFLFFMEVNDRIFSWKRALAEAAVRNAQKLLRQDDFLVAAENLVLAHAYDPRLFVESTVIVVLFRVLGVHGFVWSAIRVPARASDPDIVPA